MVLMSNQQIHQSKSLVIQPRLDMFLVESLHFGMVN